MAKEQTGAAARQEAADSIDVRELMWACLARWKWFVLSLAVTCALAAAYLLCTPPVYTRTASVLIKEDDTRGSVSDMLSDIGIFQSGGADVNNELAVFRSPATMEDVVRRLGLCNNYYASGRFHQVQAYGDSLAVEVSFIGLSPREHASLDLSIGGDGRVTLSEFSRGDEEFSGKVSASLPDTVETPAGYKVALRHGRGFGTASFRELRIEHCGVREAAQRYSKALDVSLDNERGSVVDMTLTDHSTQRAEEVLNTLISVYNEGWLRDKNLAAASASKFIDERLDALEAELGDVDVEISSYKSDNRLPDINVAAKMYMEQGGEASDKLLELSSQIYMARYVRGLLSAGGEGQLLPSSGMGDSGTEAQIAEHNRLLLQRNSLAANSGENNPLVTDMDKSLAAMRDAIARSVDNLIASLSAREKDLRRAEKAADKKVADNPVQAKQLLTSERQQKVKESLYLFLLQKREENDLSQAFTAYNTRVITPPTGSNKPTYPVRRNVLLLALAAGVLLPAAVIVVRQTSDTKLRGRKDLESLSVPLIGEIPLCRPSGKRRRKKDEEEQERTLVVKEGGRDAANEAFRVLRTNLEFMAKGPEVAIFTSFNPGSGKSFLAVNTAVCLAIRGKRVLLIDGDLRRGTSSSYAGNPRKGLSDYLGGKIPELRELLVSNERHPSLDILPAGTVPPNPTELLKEGFDKVIDSLKGEYDYVLVDCPPVEIVADARILGERADRTIFVVRAGLLERSMLSELEAYYREGRYNGMCVLLNGTGAGRKGYGYGRYGYGHYGHYGYGYGYGYANEKEEQ